MDTAVDTAPQAPAVRHQMRFEGSGGEYFKIWIVNLALSIVTLGIFSAWAKVRSKRYFNGNTYIGEHSFDYHADPIRILIGRAIAVGVLLIYGLSAAFAPYLTPVIVIALFFATPWLVNAGLRFNARNTSYRNIRFDFTGTYADAFGVYFLWPILVGITLGTTYPLARRARAQYHINNHTFGGRYFDVQLAGRDMYGIYLTALLIAIGFMIIASLVFLIGASLYTIANLPPPDEKSPFFIPLVAIPYATAFLILTTFVSTRVLKLAINETSLSTRFRFESSLSAKKMIEIVLSNLVLMLVTLGLFYPWARVRTAKYLSSQIAICGAADLEGITSDLFVGQGAIGEEVANFFDVDLGL
jgi:uncharacterized membrane protein YjgN (DUF898 family)